MPFKHIRPSNNAKVSIITLGISVIIILNALLVFALWKDYENHVEIAYSQTKNLTQIYDIFIDRSLDSIDQVLLSLQKNYLEYGGRKSNNFLEEEITKEKSIFPYLIGIFTLNKHGQVQKWGGQEQKSTLKALGNLSFFHLHKTSPYTGLHISAPYASKLPPDHSIFSMSRRLQDQDGTFSGVVVAIIDLNFFQKGLKELSSHKIENITLLNQNGQIYFKLPEVKYNSEFKNIVFPYKKYFLDKKKTITGLKYEEGESSKIFTLRKINNYPLYVESSIEKEKALKKWWDQLPYIISIFIIISTILIFFIFSLARNAIERENTVKELSESKRALEHQYKLHRNFLNALPLPAFVIDTEGRLQSANQRFSDFVGKPIIEIIGQSIPRIIEKEFIPIFTRSDSRLLTLGGEANYEHTMIEKDETERTILFQKAAFEADAGHISGLVCAMNDLTEQKQATKDLIRAETRLTEAIESYSDGFALFDSQDRLILCNANFRSAYGLISAAIRPGLTYGDLLQALSEFRLYDFEGLSRQKWVAQRLQQHQQADGKEHRYCLKQRWFSEREYRTQEGGVLLICSDITKSKFAEDALRHSEQRFRDVADAAGEYIWEIDTDLKIIFISDRIRAVIGYSPNEILGQSISNYMDGQSIERIDKFLRKQFRRRSSFQRLDFTLRHRNGQMLWQRGSAVPMIDNYGQLIGYRGVAADITQQKEAEIELINAKETAESSLKDLQSAQQRLLRSEKMASLGSLVAGIAHEVNTPIGTALTSATHLSAETKQLRKLYDEKNLEAADLEDFMDDAEEATRLLASNCSRAAELIQSFKQVAVDQTGEERRSFELNAYIHEILISLRPRLKQTKHTIKVDCTLGIIIDSYPGAFSQIITNLVMNSLLHGFDNKEQGTITITAEEKNNGIVQIIFTDNGKGIPQDHIKKIFDPFFTTKRGSGGSGLGLHILFNLVEKTLNGEVYVESYPNAGTKFILDFPKIAPKHNDNSA